MLLWRFVRQHHLKILKDLGLASFRHPAFAKPLASSFPNQALKLLRIWSLYLAFGLLSLKIELVYSSAGQTVKRRTL